MEPTSGTVDLASLAPPLRALFAGQQAALETLRAENAALTDRNRRLQEQGPEALVEDLHARVASLTDRNRNLEDRNRRLEHLVRELRRAIYGKKSEKLHPDQLLLAFEELEGALAEAEADTPASTRCARRGRGRHPGEHDADAAREAPGRGAQHRSSAGAPASGL